jgi:hypothetical protein
MLAKCIPLFALVNATVLDGSKREASLHDEREE